MKKHTISICIPALKRVNYLRRLLGSIEQQSFKDYEVIINDNSPDDSVKELASEYSSKINLQYYSNGTFLNMPANWNAALSRAKGEWIKIMHDDDWFEDKNALEIFYRKTKENPSANLFFSAYRNVTEESGAKELVRCTILDLKLLKSSPFNLFRKNLIGNPSCTMMRNDSEIKYDESLKFLVDMEYYIRYLLKYPGFCYIDKPLVNVGFHGEQVTNSTFRVAEVQIPENHRLIEKFSETILKNIITYDYYWRMYRNFGIKTINEIEELYASPIPKGLSEIISFQRRIPKGVLNTKTFSKFFMMLSYLKFRLK